jgi:hypothetical protein
MTPVRAATVFDPQLDPTGRVFTPGTNLEVPGLEAILEYGDASKFKDGRIPGAMLINDQYPLDRVRLTQLDGLHDDPEGGDTRQPNADRHGERAGQMLYRGRTLGLTGRVEAGNLGAMRNNWRRFRSQFGTIERDLIVHHPFEIPAYVNQVREPSQMGKTWNKSSSSGTTSAPTAGVTDGVAIVASATANSTTGSGALTVWEELAALADFDTVRWPGGDVWITARVKVFSATATVASLQLGLQQYYNFSEAALTSSTTGAAAVATQASPVTGTWYTLSARVPIATIAAINAGVTHVTPKLWLNYGGGGTFVLHFHQVAMVFLDPDTPTPIAYFDGDTTGFRWDGDPQFSTSSGPYWSENRVADPRFESYDAITKLLSGYSYYSTNLTAITPPMRVQSWQGDHVEAAVYHHAQHDASTTPAPMGLLIQDTSQLGSLIHVHEARTYRFSVKVRVIAKPTGNMRASISWFNAAGSTIATSDSDVFIVGDNVATVMATAPAGSYGAKLSIWNSSVTQANGVLDFYASDICFVDVTDVDPGDFYGVGDQAEEADTRRRITRPFLLSGVRKTSDMKSPEQQTRSKAWRDFTMSLRVSDPRIYCIDERSKWIAMTGNPQLVFQNTRDLVTSGVAITTAPTGFIAEGQTGTTGWHYGTQSLFDSRAMMTVGSAADSLATTPAAPAFQRAYRSAEGYTYTHPRVIIHGHFQMRYHGLLAVAFDYDTGTSTAEYNTVGILLKRISAGQWLELRVNASNHAQFLTTLGIANAPYTVELWSSHNASGASAVTRLAQWDVSSMTAISDPAHYPMIIQAEIDASQNVNVDISGYDNTGAAITSLDQTYALPAALQTLFGTTVAGFCGEVIRSDNWAATSRWAANTASFGFPWISYFESSSSNVSPGQISCPVIGDIETPQRIVLRGDINGPILQLNSTDEDGSPISSTMRLTGVAEESNPVTIDIADRTIKDATGLNCYSMLDSGSLHPLMPGVNDLVLTARGWGTYPYHAQLAWRDALS